MCGENRRGKEEGNDSSPSSPKSTDRQRRLDDQTAVFFYRRGQDVIFRSLHPPTLGPAKKMDDESENPQFRKTIFFSNNTSALITSDNALTLCAHLRAAGHTLEAAPIAMKRKPREIWLFTLAEFVERNMNRQKTLLDK